MCNGYRRILLPHSYFQEMNLKKLKLISSNETNFHNWYGLSHILYKAKMNDVGLGVSTVETNRDWDRDFSIWRDQLLKLVEIILTVETRLFYFSVEIFKIETFQSRLSCVKIFIKIVETFKTNQDSWDMSILFEISQILSSLLELFLHFWNKNLNFPHFLPIWKPILKQKSKQKMLGTKISIKMFVKIHYFSISIEKSIKIWKVSISLDKSWSRSRSTDLYIAVKTKSRNLNLNRRD